MCLYLHWRLQRDGKSFNTCFGRLSQAGGPTLLLMKDKGGHIMVCICDLAPMPGACSQLQLPPLPIPKLKGRHHWLALYFFKNGHAAVLPCSFSVSGSRLYATDCGCPNDPCVCDRAGSPARSGRRMARTMGTPARLCSAWLLRCR